MLTTDASMTAGSGCARGLLHSFKADGCTLLALVSSHAAASDVSVEEGQQESDAATCLLGELKALTVMKQYLPKSVMKIRLRVQNLSGGEPWKKIGKDLTLIQEQVKYALIHTDRRMAGPRESHLHFESATEYAKYIQQYGEAKLQSLRRSLNEFAGETFSNAKGG
eukprot:GHVU01085093.1.p1 GENE.GHVU01085093.1~~GHVU01085093.1.p1  ORF type:complete len:166 (+),score=15.41 GHVU01085093.1:270-767(+)